VSNRILGANRRSYPAQVGQDGHSRVDVTVVLVAGDIGDYAAYAGAGSDDWIARFGDKVSFEEACVHFPGGQLEEAKYRA